MEETIVCLAIAQPFSSVKFACFVYAFLVLRCAEWALCPSHPACDQVQTCLKPTNDAVCYVPAELDPQYHSAAEAIALGLYMSKAACAVTNSENTSGVKKSCLLYSRQADPCSAVESVHSAGPIIDVT